VFLHDKKANSAVSSTIPGLAALLRDAGPTGSSTDAPVDDAGKHKKGSGVGAGLPRIPGQRGSVIHGKRASVGGRAQAASVSVSATVSGGTSLPGSDGAVDVTSASEALLPKLSSQ
jgi:hypothetical protein